MDDYAGSSLGLQLLIIFILTAINAFFAAAEMAVVSINKSTLNNLVEEENPKALKLEKLLEEPTRFLSTIQVAITLAGFLSSATAASTISARIGVYLNTLGVPFAHQISVIVITIILSFITLIFGELVPKRIALQNAEKVAMLSAGTITFVSKIFKPFVHVLSAATTGVLKATGNHSANIDERISEEEIKSYIKVGQEQGLYKSTGEEMLISIFDFDDKSAYEIMTPRTDVYMIDYEDFDVEMIDEMLASGFSRIPVYMDRNDNIVGTIYIKDLFIKFSENNYAYIHIDDVMKEPYFVPESKKIDTLLKELQMTKNYVAILIDEYGGFSGMVTVEDIVEEIVGEIEDEYDIDTAGIQKISELHYIVDGSLDIDDVNSELELEMESENHETMSGLFIELLGFIPDDDDKTAYTVELEGVELKCISAKDKRIETMELTIIPEEDEEDEEDDD